MARAQEVWLIVDHAWSGDLVALSQRHHVWIADTAGNRPAIEAAWAVHAGVSRQDRGVTAFRAHSPMHSVIELVATIADHHAGGTDLLPWGRIVVVGATWDDALREEIALALDPIAWRAVPADDGSFAIVRLPTA